MSIAALACARRVNESGIALTVCFAFMAKQTPKTAAF
jgi:hypothetical protein